MSKIVEITATIEHQKWRREDFFIADAVLVKSHEPADPKRFSIKGNAPESELLPAVEYRFYGTWDKTSPNARKWGPTFAFQTFVLAKPVSRRGIIAYLAEAGKGHGLGPRTAEKLFEKFGQQAVDICREQPEVASAAVDRWPIERAQAVAEILKEYAHIQEAWISIKELLEGRGFPRGLAKQALKRWGSLAPEIIRRDPYKLMAFRGCGFTKCDSFYLDLGLNPASLKRQAYCIAYEVASNTDGSIWFPVEQAQRSLKTKVGETKVEPDKAVELARRGKIIRTRRDHHGRMWIADARDAAAEETVARLIAEAADEEARWPEVEWSNEPNGLPTQHQHDELFKATRGTIGLFCGAPGTGKAQPLDAKILTPTGWTTMGEVKPGDRIIGHTGKPGMVLAIHPQGMQDVYRITFDDGSLTECTNDHLWYTRTSAEHKRRNKGVSRRSKVRTLAEIRSTIRRTDGALNHRIPMVKPVEFEEKHLPIDGYLLGVLLGDGCIRDNAVGICNPEPEIRSAVTALAPVGTKVVATKAREDTFFIRKTSGKNNPIIDTMRQLGLAGKLSPQKHVPREYLFSSSHTRLAVLQGLLDTDGYTDGTGIEFSTTSPQLCEAVSFLVRSLGGTVSIRVKEQPTYVHKGEKRIGRPAYRVCVSVPPWIPPFRLPRKATAYIPKSKYAPTRRVVSIEHIGRKECQCITVDCPNGLYVTDDFIVTHNTHSSAFLVKSLIKQHGLGSIAIACPTGKASVRCNESFARYGIPMRASTVHSLLGVESAEGGWSFKHNTNNPLPYRYLIIDESSMLDVSLMSSLLQARARGTHLLFTGDVNQLPPVGRGAPLRDFIKVGLPYGELTEIHRNAGTIVRACHAIKDGRPFPVDSTLDPEAAPPRNLAMIHASKSTTKAKLLELIEQFKNDPSIDPIWDVQVLVAVNKKSELSRQKLNEELQLLLNPAGQSVQGSPFRVGDKVMVSKNSFFSDAADQDTKQWIANGDFGRVLEVHEKKTIVEFSNPRRVVLVPRGKQEKASTNDEDEGTGCDLILGYAATVHRYQGSSAPIIVVPVDEYPGATGSIGICDRNWLYTAISRAEKLCFLVGAMRTCRAICNRVYITRRKTYLVEDIAANLEKFGFAFPGGDELFDPQRFGVRCFEPIM